MDSLSGLLPIALVLLICPLLMLVLMRGMHGGHDAHDAPQPRRNGHGALGRSASDAAPAQKLQAIEQELAALRLELDATKRARDPERQPSEANPEKPPHG